MYIKILVAAVSCRRDRTGSLRSIRLWHCVRSHTIRPRCTANPASKATLHNDS